VGDEATKGRSCQGVDALNDCGLSLGTGDCEPLFGVSKKNAPRAGDPHPAIGEDAAKGALCNGEASR